MSLNKQKCCPKCGNHALDHAGQWATPICQKCGWNEEYDEQPVNISGQCVKGKGADAMDSTCSASVHPCVERFESSAALQPDEYIRISEIEAARQDGYGLGFEDGLTATKRESAQPDDCRSAYEAWANAMCFPLYKSTTRCAGVETIAYDDNGRWLAWEAAWQPKRESAQPVGCRHIFGNMADWPRPCMTCGKDESTIQTERLTAIFQQKPLVDCRAAFEHEFAAQHTEEEFITFKDGFYSRGHINADWIAFQKGWNAGPTKRESAQPDESTIEVLAVSRIATWLLQKYEQDFDASHVPLDTWQTQAKEIWELVRHYPKREIVNRVDVLPYDIKIGPTIFREGVTLKALVAAATRWQKEAGEAFLQKHPIDRIGSLTLPAAHVCPIHGTGFHSACPGCDPNTSPAAGTDEQGRRGSDAP